MKVEFDVSNPRKKLTGAALIALAELQDGEPVRYKVAREFFACFMVDERGRPLAQKRAFEVFGKLTVEEIDAAFGQLMERLNEQAVPKASGTSSESPSSTAEPSPAG